MTKTQNKKGSFLENLLENWRTLLTLVKMQLKEKMDMSYLRSTRRLIFKIVWLLVEFAAITVVIYFVFNYLMLLGLFSLVHDLPVPVISFIFSIMLLFSVITDTAGLMKSLYFSKDNTVLLTFPATPSLVFFSKLVTYYVYEIRKSFMFMIPMFIAYGIAKGYNVYYYPWLLLMFVIVSVLPVLISAILSIPAMFIYVFLNRVKFLQYTLYTLAAVIGIVAVYSIISLIPPNINFIESWGDTYWQIQDFLNGFIEKFSALHAFTELIVGRRYGLQTKVFHEGTLPILAFLAVAIIVLLALCFIFSKPLFCRMAATPFEFKKKNSIKTRKNKPRGPFASAIKKEWVSGLRSNSFIKLFGILVVIMPMAVFLLNKIYSAMNTRFSGTQMTICFNIIIILLILLMTNISIASVYSRDGASSYLNKVQPAPYALLLFSKLFFPMIIAFIGTVFTMGIFKNNSSLSMMDALMIGVTVYSMYIVHLFTSAESDIMNPQYEQYATFNDQANNPNESSSAILAVIYSAVVFFVALFLSSRSTSGVWTKLALVTFALAVFKVFTYLGKIKAFYKEKQ